MDISDEKNMASKSFRELIVREYVDNRKPEKKLDELWCIDEYIKFYEENKKSLNSLLLDINEYFVDNKEKIEKESNLTIRQNGCIQRITQVFTESLYGNEEQEFSQAYYELLDFIFYPGYDLKELSYNEIEIIRMMIAYLSSKADEFIKKLKNHPDEYLDKYVLQKRKETEKRRYFNLIVDNIVVGYAWITKKEYRLFKSGMYIYIEPQYRRKKYGTKFYNLLGCEISRMDIAWIYFVVNKKDKITINFLEKQINPYERKWRIGNKIIFQDVLIVD